MPSSPINRVEAASRPSKQEGILHIACRSIPPSIMSSRHAYEYTTITWLDMIDGGCFDMRYGGYLLVLMA